MDNNEGTARQPYSTLPPPPTVLTKQGCLYPTQRGLTPANSEPGSRHNLPKMLHWYTQEREKYASHTIMAPPQLFIKASLPTLLPHFSLSLSLPLSLPPSLSLSLNTHLTHSPLMKHFSWVVRWIFSEKNPPSGASPRWVLFMAEGTLLPDPSCLSLWAAERAMAGYFLLRDGEPGGVLARRSPLSMDRLSPSGRLGVPSREPTPLRYVSHVW